MNLRKPIMGVFAFLLLSVFGTASFLINAADLVTCLASNSSSVCIDIPRIVSGNVDENGYFNGQITLDSTYVADNFTGDLVGDYTTNANAVPPESPIWKTATIKGRLNLPDTTINVNSAVFADGSFVSVWRSGLRIYIQRFTKKGVKIGNSTYLDTTTIGFDSDYIPDDIPAPKVVTLADGRFVIFYTTYDVRERALRYRIINTSPFGYGYYGPVDAMDNWLGDSGTNGVRYIDYEIVAGADNTILVALQKGGQLSSPTTGLSGGFNLDVYRVNVSAGGSIFSPAPNRVVKIHSVVNRPTIFDRQTPLAGGVGFDLQALPAGKFLLAYPHYTGNPFYLVSLTETGPEVGMPVREQSITVRGKPRIAADSSGHQLLAWNDVTNGGVFAEYLVNGIPAGDVFSISSGNLADAAYQEGGSFLVSVLGAGQQKLFGVSGGIIEPSKPREKVRLSTITPFNLTRAEICPVGAGNLVLFKDPGPLPQFPLGPKMASYLQLRSSVESISTGIVSATKDISVKFRLKDSSGATWYSDTSNYYYANPLDGQGGSIDYPNGYSNSESITVNIVPPTAPACASCNLFHLYWRSAPVQNGSCSKQAVFPAGNLGGGWGLYPEAAGNPQQAPWATTVPVDDSVCYEFKAKVSNLAGKEYWYTDSSADALQIDRTPPLIELLSTANTSSDEFTFTLNIQDDGSGVGSRKYRLNNAVEPISFTGTSFVAALAPGVNRVDVEVADRAGNVGTLIEFVTYSVIPPSITIHSITDGGAYGSIPFLDYTIQSLTDVMIYVDGIARPDLVGQVRPDLSWLPSGGHEIVITGVDSQGKVVTKKVTFTIDPTLVDVFAVSVTSPEGREYDISNIPVEFTTSHTAADVWYSLDGAADTRDMILNNLADGVHQLQLSARSIAGDISSKTVTFSVKKGVPTLQVASPEEGKVYQSNTINTAFYSDSDVTCKLMLTDGSMVDCPTAGHISSGSFQLNTPQDGAYTLILTATHASGNQLSQMVHFATDSVGPTISLESPRSQLYTFDTLPITYSSNKPLLNIEYFLDGKNVTALNNLSAGPHTFMIRGFDSSGRLAQQISQFNVATLEIVSPKNGESVITNAMPPKLPFVYRTDSGFSSLSVAVDQGPRRLLTDPPGATVQIPMLPGEHEVTLRGQVYGLNSAKRAKFTIGPMNVVGRIDYNYANCDAVSHVCDVTPIVTIENIGEHDVNQSIKLRFDHVAAGGFQTQMQVIAGLPVGQSRVVTLAPIQAKLGDAFSLLVDPDHEIVGEWNSDNAQRISFQTGQITDIDQDLLAENIYIRNVSVLNALEVKTVGSVSSVEVVVDDWTFVDADKSNGFHLFADIGLLSSSNDCVRVIAKSADGVAVDSRSVCFNVRPFLHAQTSRFVFPWTAFSQGANIVDMEALSILDVAAMASLGRANIMREPNAILPIVGEGGVIAYKLMTDPMAIHEQPYTRYVDMGNSVLSRDIPNGHGIFISTINLTESICSTPEPVPVMTPPTRYDADYVDALERQYLSDFGKEVRQLIQSEQVAFIESWSGGGIAQFTTMLDFGDDGLGALATNMEFYISGYMLFLDWTRVSASAETELNIDYGFTGAGCFVPDTPQGAMIAYDGEFSVKIDAQTFIKLQESHVTLIGYASLGVLGDFGQMIQGFSGAATILNWMGYTNFVPWVPSYTSMILIGNVTILPVTIQLHTDLAFSTRLGVLNNQFYVAPITASLRSSVDFSGKIAKGDLVIYPIYFYGFGFGLDWKAELNLKGSGKYDMVGGNQNGTNSYTSHEFQYSEFDGRMDEYTRFKVCYVGVCIWWSWNHDKTTHLDDNPNGVSIEGTAYDDGDIVAALASIEPVDLLPINDLVTLGIYTLSTGDTQLANEYLACGIMQTMKVQDMPFVPLYHYTSAGVCAQVNNPDFEAVAGTVYFSDASCANEVDYKPTSFLSYCQNNLLSPANEDYVGNAAAWIDEESGNPVYSGIGKNSKWTLSHGPALDALAISPSGNSRPYMKQVEYRQVGSCSLEMRVYKKNITDANLKPLMLIHGGAWTYRGFGAIGAEALVSQLTERGFIVFQPYYRLMGSSDGPVECQIPIPTAAGAPTPGEMIIQDIDAALDWVNMHGPTLGSMGGQVALVGQSAGAHLSGWLASHRSSEISRNLLIYPPTDFPYYIQEIVAGTYGTPPVHDGKEVMDNLLGVDIATLDPANLPQFIIENSYPDFARANPGVFPPTFMLHGNADTLVPVEMSIRMCDALAGVPDVSPYNTAGGRYSCGASRGKENVMHIIDGANHILDLQCVVDTSALGPTLLENFPELGNLCPSGSRATSDSIVRPALVEAMDWLAAP